MVAFSHHDAGTPESAWEQASIAQLPRLADGIVPGRGGCLVVVAAHPDDESLGAAGLIHTALVGGATVLVIVCSAGEASHPGSLTLTRGQLAELRRGELDTALRLLRDGATDQTKLSWQHLGYPDGGLSTHVEEIEDAIDAALAGQPETVLPETGTTRVVIAAPYRFDGHSDHDAVGTAAARAAARRSLGLLEFPIWYWHWASPPHPAWQRWHCLDLGPAAHAAKQAALAAHRSQILPLSPASGDEVLLSEGFQQHFRRTTETFRWTAPGQGGAASAARTFDDLYRRRPDPWDYLGSAYEHRKRAVTLASLPRDRYGAAIEAGCSIGVLTAALADRCSTVLGIDASQVALDAARRRLTERENVSLLRAELPDGWPPLPGGTVDLVVLSEIGYFLSGDELLALLQTAAKTLRPGGDLLLCHWLHPIRGWELDGQDVHDLARSLGWEAVVTHGEEDFLLEVLRAPGGNDG
ncbi:PIG-L family deacetylase [Arthrobacter rhombi]|uniref:PIG-L family deacetylase n=1 Tax=Arthrobacter rhombi TaxID=71253 RepID=UPI003FD30596